MARFLLTVTLAGVAACGEPEGPFRPQPPGSPTSPPLTEDPPLAPPGPCEATFAWDADGDGDPDAGGSEAYDELGRPLEVTRDWDLDGAVDEVTRWTWGELGLLGLELDRDGDGRVDREMTYLYDDRGKEIEERVVDPEEHVDTVKYSGWDGPKLAWTADDQDADGVIDRTEAYGYDEDGRRVHQDIDTDADGEVNVFWTYTWDAAGRRQRSEKDTQGDGKLELVEDTVFVAGIGRSGTTTTIGPPPDHPTMSVVEERYDDLDRLVHEVVDARPIDGDAESETTIGYDEATGKASSWHGTFHVDGVRVTYATESTLDAYGRVLRSVTDTSWATGQVSTERSTWEYTCP